MATAKALKQWALTEEENITTFEAWKNNILYILSLEEKFKPFLKADASWAKKTKTTQHRGYSGENAAAKAASLELFLGQIANFAPVISRSSIVKNSTSLTGIWDTIRLYYGIQSNGARFIDFANIKSSPGKRHEALFQELTAFVEDNLLTPGCGLTHQGDNITDDEEMTPTLENMIVLTWLQLINPELPQLVKERFGTELRQRTLASIKNEISQSLPSMLSKLHASDESTVMFTSSRNRPKSQAHTWKECPICKSANRRSYDHYLTECKFLPEHDRKYLLRKKKSKSRKITVEVPISESDDSDSESDNEPKSMTDVSPAVMKVSTKKSPQFKAFYREHPVTLTLDTGAETNMIKESLAHFLGIKVKKTTHTALQADGTTPLHIVGETVFTVCRRGINMKLEALVVSDIDVDILAGTPFMTSNDIAVRPARHEITLKGEEVIRYDQPAPSAVSHCVRRTQAYVLRAPPTPTTVWPGDHLEIDIPADICDHEVVAVEPRVDLKKCDWPAPSLNYVIDGRIRLVNTFSTPITLRKCEHFCQVLPTHVPASNSIQLVSNDSSVNKAAQPNDGHFSDSVSLDPDHILPVADRKEFQYILKRYDSVFNANYQGYNGFFGKHEAVVNMGPVLPPQRKGRIPQYSKDKLEELQEAFDQLELAGVFRRPEDADVVIEYLNPSFLVKKATGGYRLVTAFADVGRYCKPSPSIMPDVDSTLRIIASWKYIIVTDLTSAFYQIPLSHESQKFCGVATPFKGTRVYCRAAMGMPGSETALEELMCRVVGHMVQEGCIAKLADDLYCGGNTPVELLENFTRLLDALDKCGLRLSAKKTIICPKSTTVLGWIWQDGSIRASPHRISTLCQAKPPTTVKGMRSFIGAYKFLSRVLPDCATVISPLDDAIAGMSSQEKVVWTESLQTHFANAQDQLRQHKSITLPRSTDKLWIVTDGSVKRTGIGSTLYVSRGKQLLLAGFFSAKLSKHHSRWLPCEIEALGIAMSIKHFAPFIVQSKHPCSVLTDSKPCVQAMEKLYRGEWSHSPRVATFISMASHYKVSIQHLSGNVNVPSDFASRNAPECSNPSCQICCFVTRSSECVVRTLQVSDILSGSGVTPFSNRPSWISLQSECGDLRRTHAHLTQGTRPSKKLTNVRDVKRYLNVASLSHDGLLVVKKNDPLAPPRELIIVPRKLVHGVLTALHLRLDHPSAHQLRQVVDRKFYALNMNDAVKQVTEACHTCAALSSVPKHVMEQSSEDPPEMIGLSFAADVMKQNKQKVFVLRETVTSYTVTCLVESETHESLRSALICCCIPLRSLDGPKAVVRVDPAAGFVALRNDSTLAQHGIQLEFGRTKNPNKNPVAERAIQELEDELLRDTHGGATITAMKLAVVTARLNSRIRSRGLSSREMWTQRSQFTNEQLPMSDLDLIESQHRAREINHRHSERSKSHGVPISPDHQIQPGDLVYLLADKSKLHARERYLVTSTDEQWCVIKKFNGPQLRNTSYKVKCSECMVIPSTTIKRPPSHRQDGDCIEEVAEPVTNMESEQGTDDVNVTEICTRELVPSDNPSDGLTPPYELIAVPESPPGSDHESRTGDSEAVHPRHDVDDTNIGNVQPAERSQPKRTRKPPSWHKDFIRH